MNKETTYTNLGHVSQITYGTKLFWVRITIVLADMLWRELSPEDRLSLAFGSIGLRCHTGQLPKGMAKRTRAVVPNGVRNVQNRG